MTYELLSYFWQSSGAPVLLLLGFVVAALHA